jgi:hypothetical protein
MKCAVIFAEGIKQVMLTPENKEEEFALKLITVDDEITVEAKPGTLYDGTPPDSARGYTGAMCQGGYIRMFESKSSLMLVLKPKPK